MSELSTGAFVLGGVILFVGLLAAAVVWLSLLGATVYVVMSVVGWFAPGLFV